MANNNFNEETLNKQIVELNELLNEIRNAQKEEINLLKNSHITNMKKLDKLQEYNKIADITNQVFEKRLTVIENAVSQISKSLCV